MISLIKKIRCKYQQPPWMTNKTKNLLKERSSLKKYFYGNGQGESDRNKLLGKSAECTREIHDTKRFFYCTKNVLDYNKYLLYNKKIPALPPLLVDKLLFQILIKKLISLTISLHQYVHL